MSPWWQESWPVRASLASSSSNAENCYSMFPPPYPRPLFLGVNRDHTRITLRVVMKWRQKNNNSHPTRMRHRLVEQTITLFVKFEVHQYIHFIKNAQIEFTFDFYLHYSSHLLCFTINTSMVCRHENTIVFLPWIHTSFTSTCIYHHSI